MNSETGKKIHIFCAIGLLILAGIFLKIMLGNRITSVEDYQALMQSFGPIGPIALTIIQALQVVFPVLPGYLGCAAGAITFGTTVGFLCNYIGISVGSIIAYFLAKKYGEGFVVSLFSEKHYNRWKSKVEGKKSYDRFLFLATLLPLFPDDFLCYFSGVIGMDRRKFVRIIVLGKPWCILAYSIAFGLIR